MTTESTNTIVAYQIQNQDKFSTRWFNSGAINTDKTVADSALIRMRETYPDFWFRLLIVTTTTEVID